MECIKRLCTICARGGSKGVPGKNIKLINGIPLIAYSIKQAINSKLFDHISVSSDSDEILHVAKTYGAKTLVKRSENMANDKAPKIPVIQNCVIETEKITNTQYDTIIDLDCTSPLRIVEDIIAVNNILEERACDNVITGSMARRSPYFNLVEESGEFVKLSKSLNSNITRRQDSPKCYDLNASIYGWKREKLFNLNSVINEKTVLYEMPEERSIDIDNMLDFEIVEFLLSRK